MKQSIKDFLLNLVISMIIGVLVGMLYIIVRYTDVKATKELIIFPILGGVIGTISRSLFIYIVGIKQRMAITAFISVFIVIGLISCLPSLYYYCVYNEITSIVELVAIIITAEVLGMSFCYYSHKRYLEFNSKLISKKNQILKRD